MVNTFKLCSLIADKTLAFNKGFSYLRSVPTNNKTSASSIPEMVEFII